MNSYNILFYIAILLLAVIAWLAWEIHQKLDKMLELQWQSFLAFEKRLDKIISKIERNH